jgi:hypothetical protein
LTQAKISYLWNAPGVAGKHQSAVSLHSHTNQSKEGLGFILEFAQSWPLLQWALEHQYKRSRVPVDLTKAHWTPPLSPTLALEAAQSSCVTGLVLIGGNVLSGVNLAEKLKELFDAGSLDFDSTPAASTLIRRRLSLSAEQAKHVGDEENQQYCPQPYAGPAARTPAGMAVVPSTEAKNQY